MNMELDKYLIQQLEKHPSIQPRDIIKLCFQAVFGGEHLLEDMEGAENYFNEEYDRVQEQDIPLYEQISGEICRVNLAAWKYRKLPGKWLFRMFAASAKAGYTTGNNLDKSVVENAGENGSERLQSCLKQAEHVVQARATTFSVADWKNCVEDYWKQGLHPVHHSDIYREKEKPAYRVVNSRYMRILPVLEMAAAKTAKKEKEDQMSAGPLVIAIEGRAASGKSTMAEQLKNILGADIIRMDDFFLPPFLRSEERFQETGGNIHYERFLQQVIPFLSRKEGFSYDRFDCGIMDYNGKCSIGETSVRIVEGSYSCHPLFGSYADITVFSDVDPEEQLRRIYDRNGPKMLQMFQSRWIPMEEAYFEKAGIRTMIRV